MTTMHDTAFQGGSYRWTPQTLSVRELIVELAHVQDRLSGDAGDAPEELWLEREQAIVDELHFRRHTEDE